MNLKKHDVKLLQCDNYLEQIEKCARICYKSDSNNNYKEFVEKLINNGHTAMLEHGTIYLYFESNTHNCTSKYDYPSGGFTTRHNWSDVVGAIRAKYYKNKYSEVNVVKFPTTYKVFITTNYRVIVENNWFDDLKFMCLPKKEHHKRYTLKLDTSIGVARELTRHRVFSFAQESTRYCNYSKDKFNNEISFIKPYWLHDNRELTNSILYNNAYEVFMDACLMAKSYYMILIENGFKPQDAREFLPLCTKTEICMTGFEKDWKHFLDLRLKGITGKPHPDMVILSNKIKEVLEQTGFEYV